MSKPVTPAQTRLLVIEHDESAAALMRSAAETIGFQVRISDSFEAIEPAIDEFDPEMIFVELRMPQHDGIEVLELLARKQSHARLFMMSEIDQSILDSACQIGLQLELDIAGTLRKPFDKSQFQATLKGEMDTRSRFTSDDFQAALGPGEFIIQYHPIIVVSAERDAPIIGVEVRPHWRNKRGSKVFMSQIQFVIREAKLVQQYNYRLMDKALESYGQWLKAGLDLGITVGMDETNLSDPDWPEFMANVVDKWKVPHGRITIVFQQEAIKDRVYSVLRVLTRLRISGFKIALETVGNEINELDEILQIPFSELRLKQVLVNRIGESMEAEFNVSTLISVAKKRDIMTCAVGVSKPEAFTFLQDCGCNTATGSLFGQSLPVAQVESFVRFA